MKGWTAYLLPGVAALLLLLYYLVIAPGAGRSDDDAAQVPSKTRLPGADAPPRRAPEPAAE